jgi:hypothetical protein
MGTNEPSMAGVPTFGGDGFFCGTEHDPVAIAIGEQEFAAAKQTMARGGLQNVIGTVNVYFHVITHGDLGQISDSTLEEQVTVMNRAFRVPGLRFNLASIDRTENSSWFNNCDKSQVEWRMKSALRQGTASDLNVYTCGPINLLGRSTFPQWYSPVFDGIILSRRAVPGGAAEGFNTGDVLVHETGHWMGLYHTFQADFGFDGQCGGNGDYVADTPDEMTANGDISCPIGRDTCPQPGLDPIENYMDYSGDACWIEFTPDQYTRMQEQFALYRAGR